MVEEDPGPPGDEVPEKQASIKQLNKSKSLKDSSYNSSFSSYDGLPDENFDDKNANSNLTQRPDVPNEEEISPPFESNNLHHQLNFDKEIENENLNFDSHRNLLSHEQEHPSSLKDNHSSLRKDHKYQLQHGTGS